MKIVAFIVSLIICFLFGYIILAYLYGKNPRKWKPLLFTKNNTFENFMYSRRSKDNIEKGSVKERENRGK